MKATVRHKRGAKAWLLLLVVLILNAGCGGKSTEEYSEESVNGNGRGKLCVYLYGDFSESKAKMICKELKNYFPEVELMEGRLALPEEGYVPNRNRYRGTALLNDLKKYRNGNVVLGLTDKVICTSNEISSTFGIMGVSYLNSGLCVSSSIIPKSGKKQTDENFIKLTLHELGHAYGLPHCPDQKCYMVDAEHRMKFPHTTGFCEKCSAYLKSAGVSPD